MVYMDPFGDLTYAKGLTTHGLVQLHALQAIEIRRRGHINAIAILIYVLSFMVRVTLTTVRN